MKTRDLPWWAAFDLATSRRHFLRAGAGMVALVASGCEPARRGDPEVSLSEDPFPFGVASGDPLPDGVVLWSRLSDRALAGAGAGDRALSVAWEIAEDESFRRVVRSGRVLARPELGHSVHVDVRGLDSGRPYAYRFAAGGHASVIGRTRTAPAHDAPADVRFAFASCQQWEDGYYTAYRHLVEEDVDFVVHLGDYIYEYAARDGVRTHTQGEPRTLDDYRRRHALYRSDADLQEAHRVAPWIVAIDDHDVANNWASGFQQDEREQGTFLLRRAAAFQAFYEFLPLRPGSAPRGPDMALHRRFRFGRRLALHVLDTRQYRSDQPCGGGQAVPCPERESPELTVLGAAQETWLREGLLESGTRWNVLANQVMMTPLASLDGAGRTTFRMDNWSGYPVARRRLLQLLANPAVTNPLVITGDIHSHWAAELRLDYDDPRAPAVATELAGTSISSEGDGSDAVRWFQGREAAHPWVHYHHGRRGYVVMDLNEATATAGFRSLPWVSRPDAPLRSDATFVVEDGRPGPLRA